MHGHTAPSADCHDQNRVLVGLGTLMRKPFRRPVRVRTAWSSPRLTRCNTVWRDTPRARVAYWTATQPSSSQRSRVEGAIPSCLAAAVTLSRSPSCDWSLGWWHAMFQWWRSDWTLLAVYGDVDFGQQGA